VEKVEEDMKVIYKEDILPKTKCNFYLKFKSLTPDFYTSPTYNAEGIKPAKKEE
jgi:hypothetical protein